MDQYHFMSNGFHVFKSYALLCQLWNVSIVTLEFSLRKSFQPAPNLPFKKKPQMYPPLSPKTIPKSALIQSFKKIPNAPP
jgi:hypothetical protein